MIEDESLGLKVTENPEETFWTEIKQSTTEDIERLEKLLKFQKSILEMVESKLKSQ